MSVCGHTWEAPHLLPPGQRRVKVGNATVPVRGDVVYVTQKCVEPLGHTGPHRSLAKVTKGIA